MLINIEAIIEGYFKIINTKYKICLNSGDVISFTLKGENLPHLLGLQNLVDIPIFEKYKNGEAKATDIFRGLRDKTIDLEEIYSSVYFEEVYQNKIRYFNLSNLLSPMNIVKFDSSLIKDYDSKLQKVEYIFWNEIESDNGLIHLGIGFSINNNISYPNTFFYRQDNQYLSKQEIVYPISHFIKRPDKTIDFKVYWSNIRQSMKKGFHYKELKKLQKTYDYNVDKLINEDVARIGDKDLKRHYDLLRLDEVKKAYEAYIPESKEWNNATKSYLISIIDKSPVDLKPNEIRSKLNEMPNKD